ncbi:hypothetical protein MTR67_012240 [Solanum verrucosum]|uniref:Uncharacterized protein n=1 Tax=Solanum verrucosum TaxID=315347 RepID=A0AAF0QCM1_SOLVR|nr:hypothetical protein MTR67_012240 [Solanum verrucosum]
MCLAMLRLQLLRSF